MSRNHGLLIIIALTCAHSAGCHVLHAQTSGSTRDQTNAAQEAHGVTSGPATSSRYTEPLFCLEAARRTQTSLQRTYAMQTQLMLTHGASVPGDTASIAARAVARACAARFTVANTPPAQWTELLQLAIIAHNDSLAHLVATRLASRSTALDALIPTLITATAWEIPRSTQFLDSLATQLATSSDPHRAYWAMALWTTVLWDAVATFDQARMQRAADRVVALKPQVDAAHFDPMVVINPREFPWNAELLGRSYSDSVNSVDMLKYAHQQLDALHQYAALDTAASATGDPFARFPVHGWIPTRPNGARATVVIHVTPGCWAPLFLFMGVKSSGCVVWPNAWVAHWIAQYGTRGLNVVVVQDGQGWFVTEAPLTVDQESKRLGWLWRDHLQLPVTVGMIPLGTNSDIAPLTLMNAHGAVVYQGEPSGLFDASLAKLMGDSISGTSSNAAR